jgi:hypothetical protein
MLFHTHVNVSFFFFFFLIFYGINRGGSQEKTSYNTFACSPLHSRAVHAGLALAPLVKHSDSAECLMENKHRKLSLSALTLESRSQPSHHLALGSWLRFFTAQGLHNPASSSPVPLADGGLDDDHSDVGPPLPPTFFWAPVVFSMAGLSIFVPVISQLKGSLLRVSLYFCLTNF